MLPGAQPRHAVVKSLLSASLTLMAIPLAGLGAILFIAGLAALDDDLASGCVSVVTPTGTQCLAVDFGVYFFTWVLQMIVYACMCTHFGKCQSSLHGVVIR